MGCELTEKKFRKNLGKKSLFSLPFFMAVAGHPLRDLVPVPAMSVRCGNGSGMAVSSRLDLVALPSMQCNGICMYRIGIADMVLQATLTKSTLQDSSIFGFGIGYVMFLDFVWRKVDTVLLVADPTLETVHIIDVSAQVHMGHMCSPGTIRRPSGIAASATDCVVGVICEHVSVLLFDGTADVWTFLRTIYLQHIPGVTYGLKFVRSSDGFPLVCVLTGISYGLQLFRMSDGSFVKSVLQERTLSADFVRCDNGWLVTCLFTNSVKFIKDEGIAEHDEDTLGSFGHELGYFHWPSVVAIVPDLGIVVREKGNECRVQVFAAQDTMAMRTMSKTRVAWMVAVARGTFFLHCHVA